MHEKIENPLVFTTNAAYMCDAHTHTHELMRVELLPLPLLRSRVNIFSILFCSVFFYCCFPCIQFFFVIPPRLSRCHRMNMEDIYSEFPIWRNIYILM